MHQPIFSAKSDFVIEIAFQAVSKTDKNIKLEMDKLLIPIEG